MNANATTNGESMQTSPQALSYISHDDKLYPISPYTISAQRYIPV